LQNGVFQPYDERGWLKSTRVLSSICAMPAKLPWLSLPGVRSGTARQWLKGGFVAAALLGGAALALLFGAYRFFAGLPATAPITAVQRQVEEQCAEAALLFHDVRWAAACMVLAEQDDSRREACLDDPAIAANPQLGKDYCNRTFPLRDGSADCDLPDARAASLNSLLADAERKCGAEAKLVRAP
jgi:hypothetical protein